VIGMELVGGHEYCRCKSAAVAGRRDRCIHDTPSGLGGSSSPRE
jgi:hypothetical protein